MKRSAIIFLMAIYVLSMVGIGINRFYCCGKLASVSFVYGAADNANHTATRKYKCCKDLKQNLKLSDSHVNVVTLALDLLSPVTISPGIEFEPGNAIFYVSTGLVYHDNSPPGHAIVPAYILHCTYRI